MNAAQLREAAEIAGRREQDIALRQRIAGTEEPLLLWLGSVRPSLIVLTPRFEARLRRSILAELDAKIGEHDQALRDRGVEP